MPKSKPKCMTIGGRQPLNRFSDKIRAEVHLFVVFHSSSIICSTIGLYWENISGQVARAGYMEVLTFTLSSHEENFDMLNRTDDKSKAVIIANPRTSEFEVNSASLLPNAPIIWLSCVFSIAYIRRTVLFGWLMLPLLQNIKNKLIHELISRIAIVAAVVFTDASW